MFLKSCVLLFCIFATQGKEDNNVYSMVKKPVFSVICPDYVSVCPRGFTCCLLESGHYGCCPYLRAVCCNDRRHCCPSGYTCSTTRSECVSTLSARKMIPMNLLKVTCPDHLTYCRIGWTCCPHPQHPRRFICCNLPDANCCIGTFNCCPKDSECKYDNHRIICVPNFMQIKKAKLLAIRQTSNGSNMICPDGRTSCCDRSTCCLTQTGSYACCPYYQATCCSDYIHCCPRDYVCYYYPLRCGLGSRTKKAVKKISGSPLKEIICPDKVSSCPDNSTCCEMKSHQYGCCAGKHSTCCPDGVHCCPNGYKCDMKSMQCYSNSSTSRASASFALP